MRTEQRRTRSKGGGFQFARKMERKAKQFAKQFDDEISGVKPWYNHAELFERQPVRIFVGLNPGGTSESQKRDKRHRKKVYKELGYCSWLDEKWERRGGGFYPRGEAPLQERAHRAFRIMYGKDNWKKILRNTPSFNVIPFRTRRGKELPADAWKVAMPWFIGVLEELQPELIICNGSSSESKSAWLALSEHYDISIKKDLVTRKRKKDGAPMAYLRVGEIKTKPLNGTSVIALPHLSTFGGTDLFRKLKRLRKSDPNLFV